MSDETPDLGGLLAQAQEMQEQLLAAQAEAAATVVEGQAGGGAVRVQVNGQYDFSSVAIEPGAVDPDDVEMLQDLVLAALRDASTKVAALQEGAIDLPDLGGLLGPGAP